MKSKGARAKRSGAEALLEDLQKRLSTIIRHQIRQSEYNNQGIAGKLGISESTLSKLTRVHRPVDANKLVELLEFLNSPHETIQKCVLMASTINTAGSKCSRYYLDSVRWVFSPSQIFSADEDPGAPLLNFLQDNTEIDDLLAKQLDNRINEKNKEVKFADPIESLMRAISMLRKDHATEMPRELADLLSGISVGDMEAIARQNINTLVFDKCRGTPGASEKKDDGITRVKKNWAYIDVLHATLEPGKALPDKAHPGLHFLTLLEGDGVVAQWDPAATRRNEWFRHGVRLNCERPFIAFDAQNGCHCFRAGENGAKVLVVLLKPRWSTTFPPIGPRIPYQ